MSTRRLFETLFFRRVISGPKKTKILNSQLLKESYIFRELDEPGRSWSKSNYHNGYSSYSSITNLPERSPYYLELKKLIDKEVQSFVRKLEWDLQGGRIEMSTCWINIMGENCQHSFHLHPHSVISGTYYLSTPRGSGSFKIEDPRIQSFMASPPKKKTAKSKMYLDITPRAGDLVLFESWLKHEVTPNRASKDRVSISFNYEWIR
ncbi:MAG: 2OG-Fe(II) oxygenase [Bdellovibrionales bacterium]|nr:2OG-Fe(II) oxygenase [Bdellovibrionales bacterium]